VPVLGVAEGQATLGGGSALGLRPRDCLACYAVPDLGLRQTVGMVEITRAALAYAEARIVSERHWISPLCRAVVTHLRWPPTAEAAGVGLPKHGTAEESPDETPEAPLELLSLPALVHCWDPPGVGSPVDLIADRPDTRYRLGEAVRLTAKAPHPCHWLVVSVEPGDVVTVLYPNPWQSGEQPQAELNLLPPDAPVEIVAQEPVGFWCVRAFASARPFECDAEATSQASPDELATVRDEAAFLAALRRFLGGETAGKEEILPADGWATASVTLEVAGE
jgi:hypothetical protein